MRSKNHTKGFCKLCRKETTLSFEHIPPRVAFNKSTRYYSFPQEEYYNSHSLLEYKPNSRVIQGGMGKYCLCEDCNNFLGQNYVRPFSDFVNIGMHLRNSCNNDIIGFAVKKQNPLRVLKQIASMFISISDPVFTEKYPEILAFVISPDKQNLPDKFRFYLYMIKEGQYREFGFPTFINSYGLICELAFPPFGYVLNIENENQISELTDITGFKDFSDSREHEIEIVLNKLSTHVHIPLDFREKQDFPR